MRRHPTLHLSKDLRLPVEAVTQTLAILAKRGAGKTYTAAVMVEEMLKAGLQVVIVDPIGVWWGLRSSADGQREGLPIVIMAGEHGDLPLEMGAGERIADVVVAEGLSVVLDLSQFRKAEQIQYVTDFAERLYHKNRQPLHLILDEADAFAPAPHARAGAVTGGH
jgi:DNA helicase HerA-like ATPase